MNFYPNTIFSLTYYVISENRNKMKECWNISSMSKLKIKTNSLQKCGASHKRSHTLVTCVTDGLSKGTLTCWQSIYGPTGCRESCRLMSINLLLVALSFHINHHHWFFLIKFTAGVNFLCFNYRSFRSACGDFHSSIYSHTTSSNQVVYFLSWLFYWKSLIFRKSVM